MRFLQRTLELSFSLQPSLLSRFAQSACRPLFISPWSSTCYFSFVSLSKVSLNWHLAFSDLHSASFQTPSIGNPFHRVISPSLMGFRPPWSYLGSLVWFEKVCDHAHCRPLSSGFSSQCHERPSVAWCWCRFPRYHQFVLQADLHFPTVLKFAPILFWLWHQSFLPDLETFYREQLT